MGEYDLMEFKPKEPVTLCRVKTETVFHCLNFLSIVVILGYDFFWGESPWTLADANWISKTCLVLFLISLLYNKKCLAVMLFHYALLCVGILGPLLAAIETTVSAYRNDPTRQVTKFDIFGEAKRNAQNPYVRYGFAGISLAYLISYIYYIWLSFSLIKNVILLNYVKKVGEKLDPTNVKVYPCMENLIPGSNLNNYNSLEDYQPEEPRTFFGFKKHYALICPQLLLIAAFYIYFDFYKKSEFDRLDFLLTFILVTYVYIKNIISLMVIHLSFTSIVMLIPVWDVSVIRLLASPSGLAFTIAFIYYVWLCYSLIKYALIKQHINNVGKNIDTREKEQLNKKLQLEYSYQALQLFCELFQYITHQATYQQSNVGFERKGNN